MTNDEICDALNDLAATCRDGEKGFSACADRLESPELRSLFMTRSQECGRAATELRELVVEYGGKPETLGTPAGALHRGWVVLRGRLASDLDLAMLEECERGEEAAVARYREALDLDLPPRVRAVVERQWKGAQHNHELIKGLRDRRDPAAA